jgi:hypothetical protein
MLAAGSTKIVGNQPAGNQPLDFKLFQKQILSAIQRHEIHASPLMNRHGLRGDAPCVISFCDYDNIKRT